MKDRIGCTINKGDTVLIVVGLSLIEHVVLDIDGSSLKCKELNGNNKRTTLGIETLKNKITGNIK